MSLKVNRNAGTIRRWKRTRFGPARRKSELRIEVIPEGQDQSQWESRRPDTLSHQMLLSFCHSPKRQDRQTRSQLSLRLSCFFLVTHSKITSMRMWGGENWAPKWHSRTKLQANPKTSCILMQPLFANKWCDCSSTGELHIGFISCGTNSALFFYVNKPTQDLNNRSPALCLAVSHTPQNIKRPLQLLLHYRQSGEIIKPPLLSGSSEQTISFWLCLRVHFRLLHNQQRSHKYFRITTPAQHVPSWSTVHYCATMTYCASENAYFTSLIHMHSCCNDVTSPWL